MIILSIVIVAPFIQLHAADKGMVLEAPSPPAIVEQPNNEEYLKEFFSHQLQCKAKGFPLPSYKWIKNDEIFYPELNEDRIVIDNGNLVFSKPDKKDEGMYRCEASNKYGRVSTDVILVKWAELGTFSIPPDRIIKHNVKLGQSYFIKCNHPSSTPEATLYWTSTKCDECENTDEIENGRISKDLNGNLLTLRRLFLGHLHFTSVELVDSGDIRIFRCNVYNYMLNKIHKGPQHWLVIDKTQLIDKIPPKPKWISEINKIAIRGQDVSMKCIFEGRPWPKVIWTKLSSKMNVFQTSTNETSKISNQDLNTDNRITYESYNQQLRIRNVEVIDSDLYECKGVNEMGRASAIIRLSVKSPPILLPSEQNNYADFYCSLNSNVKLGCPLDFDKMNKYNIRSYSVNWLKNMKPFHGDFGRLIFSQNNLLFRRIKTSDMATYTCNVSSEIGYKLFNFRIIIADQKPSIIKNETPSSYKVAFNQPLSIQCVFKGFPMPNVKWFNKDKLLQFDKQSSTNQSASTNVHKYIYKIQKANAVNHSDVFTCQASNIHGTVKHRINITVYYPTRFRLEPRDRIVKRGQSVELHCAVSSNSRLPTIKWLKDGSLLNPSSSISVQLIESDMSILTIKPSRLVDSGQYTCLITTDLDEINKTVTIMVRDEPLPPKITNVKCYDNAAHISWKSDENSDSMILNYELQYNTGYSDGEWRSFEMKTAKDELEWKTTALGNRILIPVMKYYWTTKIFTEQTDIWMNLSCWCNYTFRVIAYNIIGSSLPSSTGNFFCKTDYCDPKRHPTDVVSRSVSGPKLVIDWNPLQRWEWGCPDFWYEIYWRQYNSTFGFNGPLKANGTMDHIFITPVSIYTLFEFIVLSNSECVIKQTVIEARNEINWFSNDKKKSTNKILQVSTGYSGEDEPKITITELRLDTFIDGLKALIRWKAVNQSNRTIMKKMFGKFRGYVIRYAELTCKDISCYGQEYAGINESSLILANLPSWSDVKIQIAVRNTHFFGKWSNSITFKTPEGYPGPVLNLRAMPMKSGGIKITWKSAIESRGNVLGYGIRISINTGGIHMSTRDFIPDQIIQDPQATMFITGHLMPHTQYRIDVRPFTSQGFSQQSSVTFIKLGIFYSPSKPKIQNAIVNGYDVNISWDPNLMIVPAAIYYVKYRPFDDNGDNEEDNERKRVYLISEEEIIYDFIIVPFLSPQVKYEFILVATDGLGNGSSSEPVYRTIVSMEVDEIPLSKSPWFIAMTISLSLVLLFMVLVCLLVRERGGKYLVNDSDFNFQDELNETVVEYVERRSNRLQETVDHYGRRINNRTQNDISASQMSLLCLDMDLSEDQFTDSASFIGMYRNVPSTNQLTSQ